MDSKSAPVLTDHVPTNQSRLGMHSSLLPRPPQSTPVSSGMYSAIPRKKPLPGKLEDVKAKGWLDAMIASSPPHTRLITDPSTVSVLDESDAAQRLWLLKYPSALTSFEQIMKCAEGKRMALFLDYDGTLSPIVDDPESAFMSSEVEQRFASPMRDAVRDVANHLPTAIISGRSRDKVYEFVGLTELYYAGSHGMDIMGPDTHSVPVGDYPNSIKSTDQKVFRSLVETTKGIDGAKVENNKFCVSVHYRLVDEDSWGIVGQRVVDILKDYPRLRLTHGRKKVLEVRPVISWDKGKAVEFLLESLGLKNCNDVLPIYVGDDRTDEDAFKVLREGNQGFGILVSSVPKESSAFYSLRDPSEVMDFLKSIVKWKKSAGLRG
ncbi:hypothetical protein ACLOJK_005494 [Asimina triloba]